MDAQCQGVPKQGLAAALVWRILTGSVAGYVATVANTDYIYIYILLSGRECALKPEAGQSTPRREPCADFRLQDGIFSNFGRVTMSKDSKDTKDVMFCTQSSPAHDRTTNLAL